MKILFRADSSALIGHGHVMRCLALGDILKKAGHSVSFVTKDHNGSGIQMIESAGFERYSFFPLGSQQESGNEYQEWLKDTEEVDAKEMLKVIDDYYDLLIVDNYSLSKTSHKIYRKKVSRILVIDDLDDREFDADYIINTSIGLKKLSHNTQTKSFLGANYVALREEFLKLRENSFTLTVPNNVKKILVNIGGTDPKGHTFEILNCLTTKNYQVTVVLNPKAKYFLEVKKLSNNNNYHFLEYSSQMAKLYLEHDLIIGAAGTSSYERACLGIPTIMLQTAKNQAANVAGFKKLDLAYTIQSLESLQISLEAGLNFYDQPENYKKHKEKLLKIFSPLGIYKALDLILTDSFFVLKKATSKDLKSVFDWQNYPGARKYSRNPQPPSWEEHSFWFEKSLENPHRLMYMLELFDLSLGFVRVDLGEKNEVSIIISHAFYGCGLGQKALELLREKYYEIDLHAYIEDENIASKKIFEKCGYKKYEKNWYINKAKL